MTQLSPAIIAAAVALMVAFITPAVTNLRARRQAINDRFDAAVAALLILHAYRNTPTGLNMSIESRSQDEQRTFDVRMFEKGIEGFVTQMAATKAALAQIDQYVPEVRPIITGTWELREDQEPELRSAIERRRADAVASERLFRQRRRLPRG